MREEEAYRKRKRQVHTDRDKKRTEIKRHIETERKRKQVGTERGNNKGTAKYIQIETKSKRKQIERGIKTLKERNK